MLNLFKRPIEKSTLEAWAKMSDDVAKVAILAVPVILYGKEQIATKLLNVFLLGLAVYFFLSASRLFRRKSEE